MCWTPNYEVGGSYLILEYYDHTLSVGWWDSEWEDCWNSAWLSLQILYVQVHSKYLLFSTLSAPTQLFYFAPFVKLTKTLNRVWQSNTVLLLWKLSMNLIVFGLDWWFKMWMSVWLACVHHRVLLVRTRLDPTSAIAMTTTSLPVAQCSAKVCQIFI